MGLVGSVEGQPWVQALSLGNSLVISHRTYYMEERPLNWLKWFCIKGLSHFSEINLVMVVLVLQTG